MTDGNQSFFKHSSGCIVLNIECLFFDVFGPKTHLAAQCVIEPTTTKNKHPMLTFFFILMSLLYEIFVYRPFKCKRMISE